MFTIEMAHRRSSAFIHLEIINNLVAACNSCLNPFSQFSIYFDVRHGQLSGSEWHKIELEISKLRRETWFAKLIQEWMFAQTISWATFNVKFLMLCVIFMIQEGIFCTLTINRKQHIPNLISQSTWNFKIWLRIVIYDFFLSFCRTFNWSNKRLTFSRLLSLIYFLFVLIFRFVVFH